MVCDDSVATIAKRRTRLFQKAIVVPQLAKNRINFSLKALFIVSLLLISLFINN
jgi:hypothetical protein